MGIQAPPSDPRIVRAAPDGFSDAAPRRATGAHASASRQAGWRLSPGQRKGLVAAHIVVSVGLLGISAAQLVLATVAALTSDVTMAQAAYRSMGVFRLGVVQPLAVVALVTGVILSLGTKWGLFQHTWIVVKLALTVAAILNGMLNLGPAVQRAIALTAGASAASTPDLGTTALVAMAVPGVNVLMLGAATAISVYKPWGRIGQGRPVSRPATP